MAKLEKFIGDVAKHVEHVVSSNCWVSLLGLENSGDPLGTNDIKNFLEQHYLQGSIHELRVLCQCNVCLGITIPAFNWGVRSPDQTARSRTFMLRSHFALREEQ